MPESEAKRGEDERTRISLPERVRLVAMDLGPSFVKLGQIASTRPDVIPAAWIAELKKLQDEVNPLPFDEIKGAVEASLGRRSMRSTRASTRGRSPPPRSARSTAPSSATRTGRGTWWSRCSARACAPRSRATSRSSTPSPRSWSAPSPSRGSTRPSRLVDQFDRAITSELDFLQEAEHAIRFAKNFEGHPSVRFPRVYKEASSKQVLTLEFLPGTKVYEAIREHGHSGPAIARTSVGVDHRR